MIKRNSISIDINLTKHISLGLCFLAFTIPFSLGYPQFLVGSLVNAILFGSIFIFPKKIFWPVIILPSIAVLSRGIIFGPLTPFLVYFLPIIFLGNFILIFVFKKTFKKINILLSLFLSAFSKYILLFVCANLFLNWGLVPKAFLITMGFVQLLTALTGGLIAYLLWIKALKYKN